MQSRSLNINIVPPILQVHQVYGVRVAAACRVSLRSLLLHIFNAKLTMLSAWLIPPPHLTLNKYNISQDSIDFKVVLSMLCLRASPCTKRFVSGFFCYIGTSRILVIPTAFAGPSIYCEGRILSPCARGWQHKSHHVLGEHEIGCTSANIFNSNITCSF